MYFEPSSTKRKGKLAVNKERPMNFLVRVLGANRFLVHVRFVRSPFNSRLLNFKQI